MGRVTPAAVAGKDLLLLGAGQTLLTFQFKQQLDGADVGPDLCDLSGRNESFATYSVVSLWLRYVRVKLGNASR